MPGWSASSVTEEDIVIRRESVEAPSRRQLVHFGLLIAAIAAVVALWPLKNSGTPNAWWLACAACAGVVSGVRPEFLAPVYRAWIRFGHVLGAVSSRIVLTVLFFVIFAPAGLVMRLLGRDPLNRRFDQDLDSYLNTSEARDSSHMENPF